MTRATDPTEAIRSQAAAMPSVAVGTSCNQSSFKAGKAAFLFVGPGARGQGFKAMFKLDRSMAQARKLAAAEPDRFEVGSTGWVTARFSAEAPLPKTIWARWLRESYDVACAAGGPAKAVPKKNARKTAKKTAKRTAKKAAERVARKPPVRGR